MQTKVLEHGERIATLEAQHHSLQNTVNAIRLDVDGLKRTIWQASGALALAIWVVQTFLAK